MTHMIAAHVAFPQVKLFNICVILALGEVLYGPRARSWEPNWNLVYGLVLVPHG